MKDMQSVIGQIYKRLEWLCNGTKNTQDANTREAIQTHLDEIAGHLRAIKGLLRGNNYE